MAYASGRTYLDADSHIMERPDFIRDFVEEKYLDSLPPLYGGNQGKTSTAWAEVVKEPGHTQERIDSMVALGDGLIAGPKGFQALGAFNAEERSIALDQLGFDQQLVFGTFGPGQALHGDDVELKYAAARAHNRAMADFCRNDERLLGIGVLPLDDPEESGRTLADALELGLSAMWIAHKDCAGRSPGHDDLDPVWARLQEADTPFVLHVGGFPLQVDPVWMNTGRPVPTDWQGGGENVRGKDMIALHHYAELFLGAMIFDGVFERHKKLKGACVELGAGWVPSWLRRLDWASRIWKKEADLSALTESPSETAIQRLAFTPYVYEDVGLMIGESDPSLYLFSSDYPHFEGSKNPIERFEGFLDDAEASPAARDLFYEGNFRRIFG